MKDFINDFFAAILTGVFVLAIGGGITVSGYVYNAQRFAAYQKALETIAKCRSSKTGDMDAIFIDNLCGKVPSPADFGISKYE